MSPSRSRQQFIPARPRSEVITAVAVAAGIVIGTALLIWLMRPGTPGLPATGGLFSRQPRMTIHLLLTAAALGGVVSYVLRRRHPPRFGVQGSIGIGVAAVVVLAVVGGIFWPGGVIRHWPKQPKIINTPSSVPTASVTAPTTPKTTAPKTTTPKTTATLPKTTTTVATTTTKSG